MKTLAFFAERLDGGGVEKVLQTLLKHWDYSDYDVTLYTVRDIPIPDSLSGLPLRRRFVFGCYEGSLINRLGVWINNKVKLFVYYHFSPSVFYSLFIRERFDVAIAFIEGYATRIVSGAPNMVKRIAWLHCDIINHHWTRVAYRNDNEEIECYHRIEPIVCVSTGVEAQLKKMCGDDLRTRVVLNAIDREEIISKAGSYSVKPKSASSTATSLVSVGRLVPVKGFDRIISVIRRLIDSGYDVDLSILGEGPEGRRLRTIIEDNEMQGRIHLLGYQDNPYPYIKGADVYVCSSYSEGYNTAVVEALVLGTAVVSTDCMKGRDLLGDSEYGIVTENTEDGLFMGLKSILQPVVLQRYTTLAKQRGLSFGIERSLDEIESIIQEV